MNTNLTEEQNELFISSRECYEDGDLGSLISISILLEDIKGETIDKNTIEELNVMIEKLEISILSVDRKLDEIKNLYHYNKLDLLKSKEKLAEYKSKLNESLKELK